MLVRLLILKRNKNYEDIMMETLLDSSFNIEILNLLLDIKYNNHVSLTYGGKCRLCFIICLSIYVFWFEGSHLVVLRFILLVVCSGTLIMGLREPYLPDGIEHRLVSYKARTLFNIAQFPKCRILNIIIKDKTLGIIRI